MNREELRVRMYDMTETEKERFLSGKEIESPIYKYLESIGKKDEDGIFLLSNKMYQVPSNLYGAMQWNTQLITGKHPSVPYIRRASRFYHEPLAKADFISIRYVYSGQSHITTQSTSFTLNRNDICMFSNNYAFSQYLPKEEDIVFTFMFEKDYLLQNVLQNTKINRTASKFILNYIMEQKSRQNYIIFHGRDNDLIQLLFESILCEYLDPSPHSEILAENYIRLMLLEIFCSDYEYSKGAIAKTNNQLADILDYIDAHFSSVTLDKLSEKFGYNSKYVSRLIKQSTGHTFTEYVTAKRMDRAALLLSNSNLNIHEIMNECGLCNQTHFYRCFRDEFHMTPNEYRNSHRSATAVAEHPRRFSGKPG